MKYIVIIFFSVVFTFLTISTLFFTKNSFSIGERIEFCTKDGEYNFICIPSKGRDYQMMLDSFEKYKKENNIENNEKVYRKTSKNYLKISHWCKYKISPEWNHECL